MLKRHVVKIKTLCVMPAKAGIQLFIAFFSVFWMPPRGAARLGWHDGSFFCFLFARF
jgi:hypothetical protein